jgi:hypothetical protein
MGYWNGWSNYEDWYARTHNNGKLCAHCGSEFWPVNGRQKYCSREENPACHDDRISKKLWDAGKHPLQNMI